MSHEILASEGSRRTVCFRSESADVDKAFAQARARISRDLRIPGFRTGRVPRSMIDNRFGNLIRAEVAEELREQLAEELLNEQDWLLADQKPEGGGNLPSEGQEYIFELTFTLFETPAPQGYADLEIRLPKFDPLEAVERALLSIREKMVQFEPVERSATVGDLVLVEACQAEGNGSGAPERMALRLGDDSLGAGLDAILEGRATGDAFSARIEVAADGQGEGQRGKVTRFRVFQVREPKLPDLDDELARKAGGSETLEEFRGKLGELLSARWQEDRRKEIETQAMDRLVQKNPFDPPAYMVENLKTDFLSEVKSKPEDGTEQFAGELAAHKVKEFLLLRAIALHERLEPTAAEIEEETAKSTSRSSAIDRLRNRKALEFILSRAAVSEVDPQPVQSGEEAGGGPAWGWKILETAAAEEGK
jgi:trigger factor